MTTNYYLHLNICLCCRRYDELHIGLNGTGWKFLFQAIDTDERKVLDSEEWRRLTKTGTIFDEYSHVIPYEEFWELIEIKQTSPRSSVDEQCVPGRETWGVYKDKYGYDFSMREFS